jgi:cytochrome c-type biogenesis protein CcmH/NrfG
MPARTKGKSKGSSSVKGPPAPSAEKAQTLPGTAATASEPFLPQNRLAFASCILLALVTFAVYFRAATNPFVNYDDQGYVVENLRVQQGLTWATVRWALTATIADNWHPLTWLSHALDCQLFGLNPAGHHFTSILLHALNAVILFLLLYRATGAMGRSLVVAALFALHPINVESVAWVAERKNVLSMLFFLLTLGAYGWYARRPGVVRYLVVAALFALGLTAKPMIVTLPFVLLLVDFWPLQRIQSWPASPAFPVPQFPLQRLVLEKVPLLILSAASSVVTMIAQRGAIAPNQSLPFAARLLNALYSYAAYVGKALWPTHLASFYPYEGFRITGWEFFLSILLLAGISIGVWRQRSHLYLPVGWFWFLGTLVPVIGLVQVGNQAMADRYAYIPLIGIFWIIVWGTADLAQNTDLAQNKGFNSRVSAAVAVLVLTVLSFLTWRQIRVWRSSYELWAHALLVTKDNFMAEDYVGTALLLETYDATGQRYSEQALVHFQNAARINPQDPISHLNLGADFHEHGRLQEAIQEYKTVLELTRDPHLVVKSLIDLGAAYHQLGDYASAGQCYRQVLQMEPRNQVAFMKMGRLGMDERIQELAASASAHPSAGAYLQLGQLQQAAGHSSEASASFQTALKLDPGLLAARKALNSLGNDANR